jgi:sister chromatid cohesion protein DCC1
LISYFPLSELPADPAARFSQLFLEQKQWAPEDIMPFIEDLAPDKKKLDALLLKFTRSQKQDGRVVYGSRIK